MNNELFEKRKNAIRKQHEALITRKNEELFSTNGIFSRFKYPVLTRDHFPMEWRYRFQRPKTNPLLHGADWIQCSIQLRGHQMEG